MFDIWYESWGGVHLGLQVVSSLGCHYFLPGLWLAFQPQSITALLASMKLYCLVTENYRCQSCYVTVGLTGRSRDLKYYTTTLSSFTSATWASLPIALLLLQLAHAEAQQLRVIEVCDGMRRTAHALLSTRSCDAVLSVSLVRYTIPVDNHYFFHHGRSQEMVTEFSIIFLIIAKYSFSSSPL